MLGLSRGRNNRSRTRPFRYRQESVESTLAFYGSRGVMARLFDIPAEWRKRCVEAGDASLPGGHFFVDQFPEETAGILLGFLEANSG